MGFHPVARLRLLASIAVGKVLARLCSGLARATSSWGGTSLPDRVALRLYPPLLADLARAYERIVVVTGTNGKTTTARALAELVRKSGDYAVVTTNGEGANMLSGLATAFLKDANPFTRHRTAGRRIAVLEVDEGTVEKLCRQMRVDLVLVTNLFRDQLDRYWEINRLAESLRRALALQPQARLVLNADDPLVAYLGRDRGEVVYYGLSAAGRVSNSSGRSPKPWLDLGESRDNILCPACRHLLAYPQYHYSHLGKYRCPQCPLVRPEPLYTGEPVPVSEDGQAWMLIRYPNQALRLGLAVAGTYNYYNILAAAAAALELGVDQASVSQTLASFAPGQGRAEEFAFEWSRCTLILVKNPTGMSEAPRAVSKRANVTISWRPGRYELAVLLAINDLDADGRDVSWLWDCDWSSFFELNWAEVICSGLRARDMAVCLKYFGLDPAGIRVIPSLKRGIEALLSPSRDGLFREAFCLSTYTNLARARAILRRGKARNFRGPENPDPLPLPRTAQSLRRPG